MMIDRYTSKELAEMTYEQLCRERGRCGDRMMEINHMLSQNHHDDKQLHAEQERRSSTRPSRNA